LHQSWFKSSQNTTPFRLQVRLWGHADKWLPPELKDGEDAGGVTGKLIATGLEESSHMLSCEDLGLRRQTRAQRVGGQHVDRVDIEELSSTVDMPSSYAPGGLEAMEQRRAQSPNTISGAAPLTGRSVAAVGVRL
jgi:hypothetical protein